MSHLNNYLIEVNTYPVFKKKRVKRFLDKNIGRMILVSFMLLSLKILAEYIAEMILF